MNEIVKTNIKTKLENAMEKEGLKPSETARMFGIHPNYVSMIKNPTTWDKCPAKAWESVLTWINTGQTLKEYSEKHGKFLPVKPELKQETEPIIRVKPETLEERKQELEQRQQINNTCCLADLLVKEKEILQQKINAIDCLLKCYTS